MPNDSDFEKFELLIAAIRPFLESVVVIGGWAHRMYRLHPHARVPKHPPLMTLDADVAIPEKMPALEETIGKRLQGAGFREKLMGDHTPPVSKYTLGEEQSGFYVEFLAPLIGSRYKRGKLDATVRVAGITAQKLRHLDLLLLSPWSVVPGSTKTEVQIANPACYIAQKLLIFDQRDTADRAKDLLYIHDTIEIFADALSAIREEWNDTIAPALHRGIARDVRQQEGKLFGRVSNDIRGATEIARSLGRTLSNERLLEVCKAGLREILG